MVSKQHTTPLLMRMPDRARHSNTQYPKVLIQDSYKTLNGVADGLIDDGKDDRQSNSIRHRHSTLGQNRYTGHSPGKICHGVSGGIKLMARARIRWRACSGSDGVNRSRR